MGKLMQEFLEKDKALELAREVEKVKEDMTKQLNVNAVTRPVAEQYKKAHYSTDQSKSYEYLKTFNDIITDKEDIDNGEIYDISTGQTIREM